MTRLGGLSNSINAQTTTFNGDEVGRSREITIPQVMMNELVMPHAPACPGVQGEKAVAVKFLPDAIATPEIKCGRTGGNKHQPSSLVDRHARPAINPADVGPCVRWPGFITGFTRVRDRV